jgi:transcriptional regulator with XRE-family HTH domain
MDTFIKPEIAIGARMADIRRKAGYKQLPFAAALDVSPSAYKNYERGVRQPPLEVLVRLCTEFGADPGWLLLGQGILNADLAKKIEAAIEYVENHLSRKGKVGSPRKKATAAMMLVRLLSQDQPDQEMMQSTVELACD